VQTTKHTPTDTHPVQTPPQTDPLPTAMPIAETGGFAGPEPTRFGDWEKNGRCVDF